MAIPGKSSSARVNVPTRKVATWICRQGAAVDLGIEEIEADGGVCRRVGRFDVDRTQAFGPQLIYRHGHTGEIFQRPRDHVPDQESGDVDLHVRGLQFLARAHKGQHRRRRQAEETALREEVAQGFAHLAETGEASDIEAEGTQIDHVAHGRHAANA